MLIYCKPDHGKQSLIIAGVENIIILFIYNLLMSGKLLLIFNMCSNTKHVRLLLLANEVHLFASIQTQLEITCIVPIVQRKLILLLRIQCAIDMLIEFLCDLSFIFSYNLNYRIESIFSKNGFA